MTGAVIILTWALIRLVLPLGVMLALGQWLNRAPQVARRG
jgi:hypothetical protein